MYEYAAFIWNDGDRRQNELALRLSRDLLASRRGSWECAFRQPGIRVYHAGVRVGTNEASHLSGDQGVIVGKIFDKSAEAHVCMTATFADAQSRRIMRTKGRHLLEHYWGRYVAFLHEPMSEVRRVVVDPCGGLPCLLMTVDGVSILCSRPQTYTSIGISLSVNWPYLAGHVVVPGLQIRESGIEGVSEIIGGECVEFSPSGMKRQLYWDPMQISQTDVVEDAATAEELLRTTAMDCVCTWASTYGSLVHTLSGGLDSSIVLACMANAPKRADITCLNYVFNNAEGDEREFARAAAQLASCELVEHHLDPSQVRLGSMLKIVPAVRPWCYRYYIEHSHIERSTAQERHGRAIFSGGGGDQIFYNTYVNLALRDFVSRRGLAKQLGLIAWDVARIQGQSIWSILRKEVTAGLLGKPFLPYREFSEYASVVSPDVIASVDWQERFTPPWLSESSNLPAGKFWQVFSLSIPPVFYDPLGQPDDPEQAKPLRSQPLMEVSLRIPTYTLIEGGWDRALARRAFSDIVPASIIRRRTKGGLGDHCSKYMQANLAFVREMLIDGELAKRGILKKADIEQMLSDSNPTLKEDFLSLEDHVSTEAWLTRWTESRRRAAA